MPAVRASVGGRGRAGAEADEPVPLIRQGPAAPGGPALKAAVCPAAAPVEMAHALRGALRVAPRSGAEVALGVAVGAPLAHVAVHVVQAEDVLLVAAHLAGPPQERALLRAAVGEPAIEVGLFRGEAVAEVED